MVWVQEDYPHIRSGAPARVALQNQVHRVSLHFCSCCPDLLVHNKHTIPLVRVLSPLWVSVSFSYGILRTLQQLQTTHCEYLPTSQYTGGGNVEGNVFRVWINPPNYPTPQWLLLESTNEKNTPQNIVCNLV